MDEQEVIEQEQPKEQEIDFGFDVNDFVIEVPDFNSLNLF